MRRSWAAGLLLGVLVVSGCGGEEGAGVRVGESSPPEVPAGGGDAAGGPVADLEPCPESGPPIGRGDGLPELELPCLGPGDPVQLAGLEGRPVLVNVWASWCPPCRAEMPWLQRAHDTGELDVLGVDAEDSREAADALVSELGVTFPSVFDPDNAFAREIRNVSKPTTLLVSPEGEVVYVRSGAFASYDDLRESVSTYLDVELP